MMRRWENLTQIPSAKIAVVVLFTLAWFISLIARSRFAGGETALDASWLMGMAASFQQGLISGRDFHFTYGPAAEMLAWLGTSLTASKSAFAAYRMISLLYCGLSAVAIGLVLLLYDRISWKQTSVIYFLIALLNLFSEVPSFRVALLLLCSAFAYKAVGITTVRRKLLSAAAIGTFCFACQLVTPDVGIYGALVILITLFAGCLFQRSKANIQAAVVFLATFGVLNVVVDFLFKLSSARYQHLFDYQRYALETMRGYNNTMGMEWGLDRPRTIFLVSLFLYTMIVAAAAVRKSPLLDRCLLVGLTFASLVTIKSAFIRSDVGHIAYALAPLVFTFLVLGKTEWNSRIGQVLWCVFALALVSFWPASGWNAPVEVWKVISGEYSLAGMIREISYSTIPPEVVLPAWMLAPDLHSASDHRPLLAFPYENYIPIVLQRPLVAPVLQSYSASTEALQRYYVDSVEKQRHDGLDVVYGIDTVAVWPVDGVQTVSRVPIIFEYLFHNFELGPVQANEDGHYFLEPRAKPKEISLRDLPFKRERGTNSSGLIRLKEPTPCGLVRLDMTIAPSPRKYFFRPSGVELVFRRGNERVLTVPIRPIDIDKPFTTYVSLVNPASFYKLFQSTAVPSRAWDNLVYYRSPTDRLAARPRNVDILRVQCLDPLMFVEEDPPSEPPDLDTLFTPDVMTGTVKTGYAVLTSDSEAVPQWTAGIGVARSVRTYRDVPVRKPAAASRIVVNTALAREVGIGIANPHAEPIKIQISYESHHHSETAVVKVAAHEQISEFLGELLRLDATDVLSGTVRLTSKSTFSALGLRFSGERFQTLGTEIDSRDDPADHGKMIFPQFVMNGGWATSFTLSNPNNARAEGRIDIFSSKGDPMPVTMNGTTSNTFKYSIEPAKMFVLRPGLPFGSGSQ
jgi:hypothetical protein